MCRGEHEDSGRVGGVASTSTFLLNFTCKTEYSLLNVHSRCVCDSRASLFDDIRSNLISYNVYKIAQSLYNNVYFFGQFVNCYDRHTCATIFRAPLAD